MIGTVWNGVQDAIATSSNIAFFINSEHSTVRPFLQKNYDVPGPDRTDRSLSGLNVLHFVLHSALWLPYYFNCCHATGRF